MRVPVTVTNHGQQDSLGQRGFYPAVISIAFVAHRAWVSMHFGTSVPQRRQKDSKSATGYHPLICALTKSCVSQNERYAVNSLCRYLTSAQLGARGERGSSAKRSAPASQCCSPFGPAHRLGCTVSHMNLLFMAVLCGAVQTEAGRRPAVCHGALFRERWESLHFEFEDARCTDASVATTSDTTLANRFPRSYLPPC